MCTESRDTRGLKRQRVEYRFIGILLGGILCAIHSSLCSWVMVASS